MRQKFPGVAIMCERKWRQNKEVWDCNKRLWVKFDFNGTYTQALVEYMKRVYPHKRK